MIAAVFRLARETPAVKFGRKILHEVGYWPRQCVGSQLRFILQTQRSHQTSKEACALDIEVIGRRHYQNTSSDDGDLSFRVARDIGLDQTPPRFRCCICSPLLAVASTGFFEPSGPYRLP